MHTETTLILIREGDKLLLGKKKRRFGAGKYNGFGGKVAEGETLLESLKREIKEEADIEVKDITKIGEITFYLNIPEEDTGDKFGMQDTILVNVFFGKNIIGEPKETEEMIPEWFDIENLPYEKMWSDDIYWYPYALKGISFKGYCKFGGDNTTIIEQHFEEVENFQ